MVSYTSVRRNVIHPYRQVAILLGNSNPFLALHISPADPSAYSSLDAYSQVLTDRQGSTYIYKTYFEPFCAKNEVELDSGIASAQSNIFAFLQSRISMLIDFLWNILSKTPIAMRPQAANEGRSGQQSYGAYSLESMKGLWGAYGPAVLGGLSKYSSKPGPSSEVAAKTASYGSGAEVNHNGGQERKFAEPAPDPAKSAAQ